LNNLLPTGRVKISKELMKLSNDILQIIQILNNLSPIGCVKRSKELAKLSTDILQIIRILKIMRSTQIIRILNNFPVDSQLTKLQRRGTNKDALRDQKELAMEVTSKKL
jgi:hypothetical protein